MTDEVPQMGKMMSKKMLLTLGIVVPTTLLIAVLVIPAFLLPRSGAPLLRTPESVGIQFERVEIRANDSDESLAAWWMPAESPRAIAVLLHDGGSNRSFVWTNGLEFARDLTRRGYSVLAPDLRGHGESGRGDIGLPIGKNLAPDVTAWINFALERMGKLPVVVHGFGLGGQVAIYAGATDSRIFAVVADSTWANLRTSMMVTLPRATGLPRFALPALMWSAEHIHGVDFSNSRAVDVVEALGDRLLIIQNEADPQIPLRQLRWLSHEAKGSEVWVTEAPHPDHPIYAQRGSWGTHAQSFVLDPESYVERVVGFLDRRLAL